MISCFQTFAFNCSMRQYTLGGAGGDIFENLHSPLSPGQLPFAGDSVPFAYRDAAVRAAVLSRYAPVSAAGGDGESLRRGYDSDLAAFFLDLPDRRARWCGSRRALRAGLWHAAAGGDIAAVAGVLGRRGRGANTSSPLSVDLEGA